ncbi:hypothetical protein H5410_046104 [Solanum commersonii]|uniref:Uncharacterized protein n=1 Tax=Solanum commersonii TaxID=4109 RepID=A0A9J5XEP4_SOLCO|nr:hypothetical protein H5410_046104 [Solanum commersonii]
MKISSLSSNLPRFKWFLSDTHSPYEGQPTPYPTHSPELSSWFPDLSLKQVKNTWVVFYLQLQTH